MIRRVLACLNITGFRRYAIQLVNFLEKEIYGQANGFELYMKNSKEFDQKAFQTAPLKKFVEKPQIFQILSHYGDHHDNLQRIKLLEENCLAKYPEDFQMSVYFNGR